MATDNRPISDTFHLPAFFSWFTTFCFVVVWLRVLELSFYVLLSLYCNRGTAPETCTLPSGLCCGYD